jgi:cytochrome c peroxidase
MKATFFLSLSLVFCMQNVHAHDFSVAEIKKMFARPKLIPYMKGNEYSKQREELGKALFFDTRLSGPNSMSCASCHNPSFGWGDGLPKGVGFGSKELGRKSPTILNLAWTEKMMWDGRFSHLEGQALGPIGSEAEMNMNMGDLVQKIKGIEGYRELFARAYPEEKISLDTVAKALAVFERGVVSGKASFDRWINGDENAISDDAKRGFVLFNTKASCVSCHSGWRFTDDSFHDIGINDEDIGRGKHLKLLSQQHAFKVPGLRNITHRGPYMHNGQEKTLMDVIEFYNRGGDVKRESLSQQIKPLNLTDLEKQQLVSFLKTLTSKDKAVELPILPR